MVGVIPWNVPVICETFKTSYRTGKLLMNGALENHPVGQSFLLGRWLNIIRFLRKTSRDYSCLVKKLPGIFIGYVLYAGESRKKISWSPTRYLGGRRQDILVADSEELENSDTSEIHAQKLNAKEVLVLPNPVTRYSISLSQIEQSCWQEEIRYSESNQDETVRGEEHSDILQGESDGSQLSDQQADDTEVRDGFWSFSRNHIYRHHLQSRVKLLIPSKGSFQIPLKSIAVVRQWTNHSFWGSC